MNGPLCSECRCEADRWLDTSPAMLRPIRIAAGASYDDTAGGVSDNRRNRHNDWARLVNFQTGLIVDSCGRTHRLGQVALFEVAGVPVAHRKRRRSRRDEAAA